jgi:hypothetical protein
VAGSIGKPRGSKKKKKKWATLSKGGSKPSAADVSNTLRPVG